MACTTTPVAISGALCSNTIINPATTLADFQYNFAVVEALLADYCALTSGGVAKTYFQDNSGGDIPAVLVDPTLATPNTGDAVVQGYDNGVVLSVWNGTTWDNITTCCVPSNPLRTESASYNMTTDDIGGTIVVDLQTAPVAVTLLSPSTLTNGTIVRVKILDLSFPVNVVSAGGELFDKTTTSVSAFADGDCITFQSRLAENDWILI